MGSFNGVEEAHDKNLLYTLHLDCKQQNESRGDCLYELKCQGSDLILIGIILSEDDGELIVLYPAYKIFIGSDSIKMMNCIDNQECILWQDLKFILKMFNKEEVRKQVIQYFRSVGSGQNIVQCIKQALFLHQKFNPVMLFEVLSKGKQRMTKDDWRQYLVKRSISFEEDELRYFCNHNNFGSEITLNEFLQSMIPYNADVVREFKAKYLDSLQIRQFDPEVQFIFAELMNNWIKFLRSLIKIRTQITSVVTRKQIQQLIKEDLVLRSKPREARKFHQAFQAREYQLTFHQLRKFLQLWISSKEIIHQFYLLNVKRHIKCQNPFEKIVFKSGSKSKSKSQTKQRAISSQKQNRTQNNGQKRKQYELQDENYGQQGYKNYGTDTKRGGNKYQDFKRQILEDYVKEKHGLSPDNQKSQRSKSRPTEKKYREEPQNQQLRRSRYSRESKNIDGTNIVKIFEEIIIKEERLQKLRKKLAKMNDFNLINLFKLIDYDNKGYVSSKSISDFTGDTSVQYSHLVGFHARERDRLRFQQFCVFFRPLSKQLNDLLDKRPEHKVPNPFKRETQKLILEILHLTAEMHYNIFRIKERINRDGIDPLSLFTYVDLEDKGFIEAECIKVLLQEHNVYCESKDMKCLMKLFRKKVDERILPKEFINFIDL